jgi:hypothetical protein
MTTQPVRLKVLLQQRHWQTHRTFCTEYDKAARQVDKSLVGSAPSRPQLHRWLSGALTRLPHPHHCRVLEAMFPGWSAMQLFEPYAPEPVPGAGPKAPDAPAMEIADVFEAVTAGLDAPDSARIEWGQASGRQPAQRVSTEGYGATTTDRLPAAISDHDLDGLNGVARDIGRKLVALQKVRRLSRDEVRLLAGLAGNVVDLALCIDIDIAEDGWARLAYRHELLNLSDKPLTRISRELWFENTRDGRLKISPVNDGDRRVAVQRIHDTPNLSKFACQISPAVQPGDTAVVQYTCEGGRFVEDHYWNQSLPRYTRHFTMRLRHHQAGLLTSCAATEEHPDGSENSATEELLWDYEGNDVVITLTRDYLRPNQAVTLRWEVDRVPA